MSATTLREKTRAELFKQIEQESIALAHHNDADADIHRRQGVIRGLQRAIDALNNNYKDLNG